MTSTSTRARNHTRPVTCHFTMHTTHWRHHQQREHLRVHTIRYRDILTLAA
ncbi:hypothetical protein ACWEQL_26895 [Kitasatospora sp. NPDC004240]